MQTILCTNNCIKRLYSTHEHNWFLKHIHSISNPPQAWKYTKVIASVALVLVLPYTFINGNAHCKMKIALHCSNKYIKKSSYYGLEKTDSASLISVKLIHLLHKVPFDLANCSKITIREVS